MKPAFFALLIFLRYTGTANSLTDKEDADLLAYLQAFRKPNSMRLVLEKSDNTVYNGKIVDELDDSRPKLKEFAKYAELVRFYKNLEAKYERLDDIPGGAYSILKEKLTHLHNISGVKEPVATDSSGPSTLREYVADGKTYKVGKRIGLGSFGKVLEAYGTEDNKKPYAVKIELPGVTSALEGEYQAYQEIRKYHGGSKEHDKRIVLVEPNSLGYWNDGSERYRAMVMERLGPDAFELFYMCWYLFSTSTIVVIIQQIIMSLILVHRAGYVHCDVKPDNFLLSGNVFKLADFGGAVSYANKDRGYSPPVEHGAGTPQYVSLNQLEHALDLLWEPWVDLEVLDNNLLFLWLGDDAAFYNENLLEHIQRKKLPPADLCVNCSTEFVEFLEKGRQKRSKPQKNEDIENLMPDYPKIQGILEGLKVKLGITDGNFQFDWDRKSYAFFEDPQAHFLSYNIALAEGDQVQIWLSVSKFYSDILRQMQSIRPGAGASPFILENWQFDQSEGRNYPNGSIRFEATVTSLLWKDVLPALKPQNAGEGGTSATVPAGVSEVANSVFLLSCLDPIHIYLGFECAVEESQRSNGKSEAMYRLTINMAPELVESELKIQDTTISRDLMKTAYHVVTENPTPPVIEFYEGTTSITMVARAGLAAEDTVSREILCTAILQGKLKLLQFAPGKLDPNTLGYAYRIDNINNCTVFTVAMFIHFYYDVYNHLQTFRRQNDTLPFIVDGNSNINNQDPTSNSPGTVTYTLSLSTINPNRITIYQDFKNAISRNATAALYSSSSSFSKKNIVQPGTLYNTMANSIYIYVTFVLWNNMLVIKFEPLILEGELKVNVVPALVKDAKDSITPELTPQSDRLNELIVARNQSVTTYTTVKLTNTRELTRVAIEPAIKSCREALSQSDVVGVTDKFKVGIWFKTRNNWNEAIVSVTVERVSDTVPYDTRTFVSGLLDKIIEIRSNNKIPLKKLEFDGELGSTAQREAIADSVSFSRRVLSDSAGTKTFIVRFDGKPHEFPGYIEGIFVNPETAKLRGAGLYPHSQGRTTVNNLRKLLDHLFDDNFKEIVRSDVFGLIGVGLSYNKSTNTYSLVVKFQIRQTT